MDDDNSDKANKENLTPEQYQVCRLKGTEAPFTGKYWDHKEDGIYQCVCCGAELFRSRDKFDSGSGWPSYIRAANSEAVNEIIDKSHGMERIEITCKKCNAHLGHVFPDGPQPTGMRFCINSASLKFIKDNS